MNPEDALRDDWPMYYEGCWMLHIPTQRVVQITLERGGGFKYRLPAGDVWHNCEAEQLECWWPRAGSYNIGGQALFIGRRARRSMKKSAYDHYFVSWGRQHHGNILKLMAKGPNFVDMETAQRVIRKGITASVAISTDLIIAEKNRKDGVYEIIYRGTLAGELRDNQFIPIFDGTPAAKRAELKLVQEGVRCI